MPFEEPFALEVIEAMWNCLDKWQRDDVCTLNGVLEATLVKSYWQKEEVWRAYKFVIFELES